MDLQGSTPLLLECLLTVAQQHPRLIRRAWDPMVALVSRFDSNTGSSARDANLVELCKILFLAFEGLRVEQAKCSDFLVGEASRLRTTITTECALEIAKLGLLYGFSRVSHAYLNAALVTMNATGQVTTRKGDRDSSKHWIMALKALSSAGAVSETDQIESVLVDNLNNAILHLDALRASSNGYVPPLPPRVFDVDSSCPISFVVSYADSFASLSLGHNRNFISVVQKLANSGRVCEAAAKLPPRMQPPAQCARAECWQLINITAAASRRRRTRNLTAAAGSKSLW
jgi:hypothetical protein